MTALNACTEKQEWLDNGGENLTVADFNKQKQVLCEILEPIVVKMSEPRKLFSFQKIKSKKERESQLLTSYVSISTKSLNNLQQ